MSIREPAHDATIVEICQYWHELWKERAAVPVPTNGTQNARVAATFRQRVAESTALLWKLRADYERSTMTTMQNDRGYKEPDPMDRYRQQPGVLSLAVEQVEIRHPDPSKDVP